MSPTTCGSWRNKCRCCSRRTGPWQPRIDSRNSKTTWSNRWSFEAGTATRIPKASSGPTLALCSIPSSSSRPSVSASRPVHPRLWLSRGVKNKIVDEISLYSSLVKFMKNVLLPTDLLLKTENSKAFIYLRVKAIIFLKNELCTEMNQTCEYNIFVFLQKSA